MNQKNLIVISIIVIIAVAVIFYIIGHSIAKNSAQQTISQYEKVIDYYAMIPEEIFSVSGKITEIQGSVLSISAVIEDAYKLPEDWEEKIIKISINNDTKITKTIPDADLDEEGVKEISFSTLKTNDKIIAVSDENIKNKVEFTAISINVLSTGD